MTDPGAMLVLPLLHAGQTAVRLTTLDVRVTAGAVALFAASAAWIWRPSPLSRALRKRNRRAAGRVALTALIFLAVLPSVLPYDHLLPGAHADDAADESVHASHCHISPGTCSDAPVTAGLGQLMLSGPLVVAPAMLAVLLIAVAPLWQSISTRPEVRPPLLALAH